MKKIFSFLIVILIFVAAFLITTGLEMASASDSYPFTGTITADSLVVHSSASSSSSTAVTELAYGTRVTVTGLSGSFYKITYNSSSVGYVSKNYVKNVDANILTSDVSGIESYSSYCSTLQKEGFPSSYCPYLYYLHSKYSNWTFKADIVGSTLDTAAASETWKCVLQTTNSDYWLSSTAAESNYYNVNASVIATFMDPRNSMYEDLIFQFLDFESSKDLYNDSALSKIAGSGNLSSYYSAYKEAASTYGVNALHLMSRSKQEGANSSTFGGVTGTYSCSSSYTCSSLNLTGYYNYYNIGAYGVSGSYTAVGRGLAYAAGLVNVAYESDGTTLTFLRPWNTPELAIKGGAKFLAETYVQMGQNTNYFEKFNVSSSAGYSLYTHQYMTNIYAPASEALTIYSAYNYANMLNSKFTFVIPVYEDMDDDASQILNTDSSLSSITVDDSVITGFDSDVTEYTYNIVTSASTVKVGAKTSVSTTSVTGTGNYTFTNGTVKVNLVATAEDGSKTTYVITINQVLPENEVTVSDVVSKMGVKVNSSIMYGISPGMTVSTLINTVTKNGGTASVTDSSGKSKTSGTLSTGDKITINGTSDSYSYSIAVRGDINGDGSVTVLDLLRCQKHILKSVTLTGVQYYAADTNYDSSISVLDLLKIQKHILGSSSL